MNNRKHYSTEQVIRTAGICLLLLAVLAAGLLNGIVNSRAEDQMATCWVMCKPGSTVNVRKTPGKKGAEIGYLEAGDSFRTDGTSSNGFIRCYGIGECAGWVYSGYVVTEQPKAVFENYVYVAPVRAACRRWIGGPQVEGRSGWLNNLDNVSVFYTAEDWACTSRGYIRSEWLEVNPE